MDSLVIEITYNCLQPALKRKIDIMIILSNWNETLEKCYSKEVQIGQENYHFYSNRVDNYYICIQFLEIFCYIH